MHYIHYLQLFLAAAVSATPVLPRGVPALNSIAFDEAHQRDGTATRALSNIQIHSGSGKCLYVDKLSGDSRANLTPLQLADCGTTDGQRWDVITAGKHNNQPGKALIVNTLTQACLSVDPRRPSGSQVHLFSCGGRADGSGQVADSQLFPYSDDGAVEMNLSPDNSPGMCLFTSDGMVDITPCNGSNGQEFTFGDDDTEPAKASNASNATIATNATNATNANNANQTSVVSVANKAIKASKCSSRVVVVEETPTFTPLKATGCGKKTVVVVDTVIVTVSPAEEITGATSYMTITETAFPFEATSGSYVENSVTYAAASTGVSNDKVTPVSLGGNLNPSAAAEANTFDDTARRALESVNIRSGDGRCLSVNPLAGDFRENLIPVELAECSEDQSQKFDVVTSGKHNDGKQGGALIVSVLTDGCLTFDGRRAEGDTVTMFSCGGRADGDGETSGSQLFPFDRTDTIVLEPAAGDNMCLVPGEDRLVSAYCDGPKDPVFELVRVL